MEGRGRIRGQNPRIAGPHDQVAVGPPFVADLWPFLRKEELSRISGKSKLAGRSVCQGPPRKALERFSERWAASISTPMPLSRQSGPRQITRKNALFAGSDERRNKHGRPSPPSCRTAKMNDSRPFVWLTLTFSASPLGWPNRDLVCSCRFQTITYSLNGLGWGLTLQSLSAMAKSNLLPPVFPGSEMVNGFSHCSGRNSLSEKFGDQNRPLTDYRKASHGIRWNGNLASAEITQSIPLLSKI